MFRTQPCKFTWLTVIAMIVAGSFTSSVSAQEPDARALLGRMSAEIAGLDSFIVSGDAYADARLAAGQIIELASTVIMRVRKPGEMRLTNRSAEGVKELFFGGGVLSFYSEEDKFYAQIEIPEGIGAAAEFAVDRVGIDAPLLDFVSKNLVKYLLDDAEEVQHLGTSLIRGDLFEHIGIRTPEVDLQFWIASEGRPLPGKMAMSSKWEGGSPRFVAFFNWDTKPDFPADSFKFVPPQGATKIEFVLDP